MPKVLTKEEANLNDKKYTKLSELWWHLNKADQLIINDPEFKGLSNSLNLEMARLQAILETLQETFIVQVD
jgi:hypothetical protein